MNRLQRFLTHAVLALSLAGCAAQTAFREGAQLAQQGQLDKALERYEQAVQMEPGSVEYRMGYLRIRERLALDRLAQAARLQEAGDLAGATAVFASLVKAGLAVDKAQAGLRQIERQKRSEQLLHQAELAFGRKQFDLAREQSEQVLLETPRHPRALALLNELARAGDAASPTRTALAEVYRKTLSIEFKDTPLKTVFEVMARSSGLNFVFDREVRGDQRTSVYLRNSTTEAALRNLLLTNQLEMRVLDENSVLIYPASVAKQREYQPLFVRAFYLANADAKAMAGVLKNLLRVKDPVIDEKLNMLVLRDSAEAIKAAERVVALHDVPEPEVMLEVEVMEVKRTRLLDLGVRWPDQLGLSPLGTGNGGTLTLADLRNLDASSIGASVSGLGISAKNLDTDANLLANPRIRARNREKARVHVGERVPNITTTSTATGFVAESVTYVDVGLKLDVEPTVYLDNEVAIKVALEVSSIINQVQTKSGTLAYRLGTRTASTVLRLRDGENQVLAGLISDEDRTTANKVPLLGSIPLLGRLFGNEASDGAKTEVLLSITPRIIRNVQRPGARAQLFETGTEASFGGGVGAIGAGGGALVMPAPEPPPKVHAEEKAVGSVGTGTR